ncbi:MAG: D-2-hydroxyacid dehydrogenase, partial [Phycisphaeraceae bacterium]|nr:D-2-hydroxyacid dehydrogenase [Phycisphaeraceae bacterium]
MTSCRIVCLDGWTLSPGDLPWTPFEELGELVVHDRTPADQIVERAAGFDAILTNKTPLMAPTLAAVAQRNQEIGKPTLLRYIGVLATGYNIVDVPAAKRGGAVVTNVPAYSTASVAQHVFALLLELTNHVGEHSRAVRSGQWAASPDFSFTLSPLVELAGKTFGIVGLGEIGRQVARIAQAMGMRVIAAQSLRQGTSDPTGDAIARLPLDEVLAQSDVVSLHVPLTEQTRGLINAARLTKMKPTAYLINTGRGPLVDEQALADALAQGRLAGAGVDVLTSEPPKPQNPLLTAPRCVITPHVAWA